VERGIFESEDEARGWVLAGQVLVNGQRLDKPGMAVPDDALLRVRGRQRYASRGGLKLEAALDAFAVSVAGRVALDSGASTGGFTDCLLQRGAALVYAVEAG
jgi:23S rRNA (cytidine1920-2'-O)/16S rRNA (cytidine1409-2'-O)-methyltransferase